MKKHLTINGHQIYLETYGRKNAPPVIFLHHGLGAVRSWKEQTKVFAAEGFYSVAYDRWGHGKSDPRQTWGMPHFTDDLADLHTLLSLLGLDRVAMVGHSDGGKIAMYYAVAHPELVACLVLIAAHIYIERKMYPGILSVKSDFENNATFREKMRRVHGNKAESLFWGWFDGWNNPKIMGWDMRPLISAITCPTLVIQGTEDEHATPQHARDIAASMPGAELWLLPGAGHMLPQDHPEEFNRHVIRFLRKHLVEDRWAADIRTEADQVRSI